MIRSNLGRQLAKGRISGERLSATLAQIEAGTSLDVVAKADLAIEAVPEVAGLKREIFAELDRIAPAGAILASNTSSISITKIAAATGRPEKVIGMHFHESGAGDEAGRGHPWPADR